MSSLAVMLMKKVCIQGHIQRLSGGSGFFGKMTKREAEGIATLRSSDNIRRHNKI